MIQRTQHNGFQFLTLKSNHGVFYTVVISPVNILVLTKVPWKKIAIGQNELLYGNLLFKTWSILMFTVTGIYGSHSQLISFLSKSHAINYIIQGVVTYFLTRESIDQQWWFCPSFRQKIYIYIYLYFASETFILADALKTLIEIYLEWPIKSSVCIPCSSAYKWSKDEKSNKLKLVY